LTQSDRHRNTALIRFAFVLWLAVLVMVSLLPLSFKWKLHTHGSLHDYLHYAAFFVTAIFLWLISKGALGRTFAFAAGLIFSYLQEWAENWIYHAGFEWRDVITDFAGLLSGFALMFLITSLLPARRD
jgi:glycopeptide antibiotics resistance protein